MDMEIDLSNLATVNTMFAALFSKLGVPIKTTISANVLEEALNGTVTVKPLPIRSSVSGKILVVFPIEVVGSEEFWPNSGHGELLPPLPKAMPGRPRKARRKRKFEPKKSKTKLSRHGRDMHCGICKSSDHNKRSCPSKPDAPV